ncbi:hypothetical protein [Cytophaga sp. FL35]|uniref:hypothetical protein n=1 Tax=Cytophaga sp. FL35 TaxID=1904456 RepID=UPI001653DD32|nr:hypothetical protein [Cytophaga sp. FL35]MBC7000370.1 hypothetical protein [Cytophaga sp. FL35]
MGENLKVDRDYLESFNLGYELAKELKITQPMFKSANQKKIGKDAMLAGMLQYFDEAKAKKKSLDEAKRYPNNINKSDSSNKYTGKNSDLKL